jgi:hypothetical protein
MKIVKIILLVLLGLIISVLLLWGILHFLIWQKPEILSLIPSAPVAYVSASNLEDTILAVEGREFSKRLFNSQLWKDLMLSESGQRFLILKSSVEKQWKKQTGESLEYKQFLQLVKKDAVLALYSAQGRWDLLLVSEVDVPTRLNITSGSTKRSLSSRYEYSEENYKGVELVTVRIMGYSFSYGFIGRGGLLSTDTSLLKRVIDIHRKSSDSMADRREFKSLTADLPSSDISFYINLIKAYGDMGEGSDPSYLVSLARDFDELAGVAFRSHGNIRFDISVSYAGDKTYMSRLFDDKSQAKNRPFVSDNCLMFLKAGNLDLNLFFNGLEEIIDSDMADTWKLVLPTLHNGMTLAVFPPDLKILQLLPPLVTAFDVRDISSARNLLGNLRFLETGNMPLLFDEIQYENTNITRVRIPIVMGMALDTGYMLMEDYNLLGMATDISALRYGIDVVLDKRKSITEDDGYIRLVKPIAEGSVGDFFIKVKPTMDIASQAARLYSLRAKIAGERRAERIANVIYQNASLLDGLSHFAGVFDSDGEKISFKFILDTDK